MRRRLLSICAIAAVSFFAGLGRAAISESDEAFYAEAGREMVESGDYLTPHFNYEPRFQKPILYYWIVTASYRASGVSEAAARFGSALSGVGLALLTFVTARRMFNDDVAFGSAAIVATNFGYFAMAHLSLPDLPLTFFITLTIWLGFRAFDRSWAMAPLVGAAAAAALGVLTKGPLGLVVPCLVLAPVAIAERRWTTIRPVPVILAGVVCAVIAVPWYAAMTWVHGVEYLRGFLVGDNVERFATARFNDPRAPWYYLPVIAGGLLPWTPLSALLIAPAWRWVRRRRRLDMQERRLVLWVLLPLAFFTLSIGKQARYILPILPPLAILAARAVDVRVAAGAGSPRVRAVRYAAGAAALILLLVGITMWRIRPLLAYGTDDAVATNAALLVAALAVGAAILALRARAGAIVPGLTVASASTLIALQFGAFSTPQSEPVEVAAAFIKAERRTNEEIGVYHALDRNLVFYTHIRQTALQDHEQARALLGHQDRVLAVMPLQEAATLERTGARLVRLAEFRYFDPPNMKLDAVVAPNPARDLTSIVVVANK